MNSKESSTLRRNILKGDYRQCPRDCHVIIKSDRLNKRFWQRPTVSAENSFRKFWYVRDKMLSDKIINISAVHDNSCNLHCIMCRKTPSSPTLPSEKIKYLWKDIYTHSQDLEVLGLGGSGEPLIQKESLDILFNATEEQFPKLKSIGIITNGINFTENFWSKVSPFCKSKISLQISIDATTKRTYEKVRRGGNFDQLLKNLDFISELNLQYFGLSMVFQKENYKEMRDFIDFSRRYNALAIFGEVLGNPDKACHLASSQEYKELIKIVSDDEFASSDVIGNIIQQLREQN